MTTQPRSSPDSAKKAAPIVAVGVIILLGIVGYTVFLELFSFGVSVGEPLNGKIPDVPVAKQIDTILERAPVLGDRARHMIQVEQAQPANVAKQDLEAGPQVWWREYIKWWGWLLVGTGLLMLIVKRFVENTEDETTVMHLKGDTDTALRAKGGRG